MPHYCANSARYAKMLHCTTPNCAQFGFNQNIVSWFAKCHTTVRGYISVLPDERPDSIPSNCKLPHVARLIYNMCRWLVVVVVQAVHKKLCTLWWTRLFVSKCSVFNALQTQMNSFFFLVRLTQVFVTWFYETKKKSVFVCVFWSVIVCFQQLLEASLPSIWSSVFWDCDYIFHSPVKNCALFSAHDVWCICDCRQNLACTVIPQYWYHFANHKTHSSPESTMWQFVVVHWSIFFPSATSPLIVQSCSRKVYTIVKDDCKRLDQLWPCLDGGLRATTKKKLTWEASELVCIIDLATSAAVVA